MKNIKSSKLLVKAMFCVRFLRKLCLEVVLFLIPLNAAVYIHHLWSRSNAEDDIAFSEH